ncbi:MAG TPA: CBS domain-containing protein [Steroidobacteraceae bacterium]|nr:CBS domain-containing protein [Steroidobacteraceae bacterium]
MSIADLSSAPVYTAFADQPLAAAAREMRARDVGALVVVDSRAQRPVGILTDRDIVRGQVERRADLHCLTVGEVMTPNPVTVPAAAALSEAIQTMSAHGVRRAPVVDRSGALQGIVTLDDLLPALAQQLSVLAGIADAQARQRHA